MVVWAGGRCGEGGGQVVCVGRVVGGRCGEGGGQEGGMGRW